MLWYYNTFTIKLCNALLLILQLPDDADNYLPVSTTADDDEVSKNNKNGKANENDYELNEYDTSPTPVRRKDSITETELNAENV